MEISNNAQQALQWITHLLEENHIPFQVAGGLAANIYGVCRPLHDIDIDVPDECLPQLMKLLEAFVVTPLHHYQDQHWQMQLMTLSYHQQLIDIAGGGYRLFHQTQQRWVQYDIDFSQANIIEFSGLLLPVISREELIAYKKQLQREVDREDLMQLQIKGTTDTGI